MNAPGSSPFVVDTDSHVMEPPDLWQNYLEPQYRDRAIHVRRNSEGIEELVVDNKVLMTGRLASPRSADRNMTQGRCSWIRLCPVSKGARKPVTTRMPASPC